MIAIAAAPTLSPLRATPRVMLPPAWPAATAAAAAAAAAATPATSVGVLAAVVRPATWLVHILALVVSPMIVAAATSSVAGSAGVEALHLTAAAAAGRRCGCNCAAVLDKGKGEVESGHQALVGA